MENAWDHLAVETVEAMARHVGLHVDGERAERLRNELVASRAATAALDAALEQHEGSVAETEVFDAAWNGPGRGGKA